MSFVLLTLLLLAYHPVGEPTLEESEVWRECCASFDCEISRLFILGGSSTKTLVLLGNEEEWIDSPKFRLAPTVHVWVCYVDINGQFKNDNIRCILIPQKIPLL